MSGMVGTLGGREALRAYHGQAVVDAGSVAALRGEAERHLQENPVPARLPGDVVSITPDGRQDDAAGMATDVARPLAPVDADAPVDALTRRAANRAYAAIAGGSRPLLLSGRV